MASRRGQSSVFLGPLAGEVEKSLRKLAAHRFVERIWQLDYTLWGTEPRGIQNRLGWLTSAHEMRSSLDEMKMYADSAVKKGLAHIVILGMGGSALGAMVLSEVSQDKGRRSRKITILDTTVPDTVQKLTDSLDLARTIFVVASKSGSTLEPIFLYQYFREIVNQKLQDGRAGQRFIAISDPGSPLVALAQQDGFDRVFESDPNVGGRFSVLSFFGLLPSIMAGVDVGELLDRAIGMAADCQTSPDLQRNPGAVLGAFLASCSNGGRDKMTMLVSPSIASLGIWAEQLLAESLGKNDRGVIPVVREPLFKVESYGDDRSFVYVRLEGDDNAEIDVHSERLAADGHPVVRIDLPDVDALGAELFRWEFAVATAGFLMDIQPFDEPNVQSAKDATDKALRKFEHSGSLDDPENTDSLDLFLRDRLPGDYLALLAYITPTDGVESALQELRRAITERYGLVTTVGYGPRYLHSTGQLHKGGPPNGAFVQLLGQSECALPIPGTELTFDIVVRAQANGDYAALKEKEHPVIRLDLGIDPESGLLRTLARFK